MEKKKKDSELFFSPLVEEWTWAEFSLLRMYLSVPHVLL